MFQSIPLHKIYKEGPGSLEKAAYYGQTEGMGK